jgi:type IV pilus assembly protein PilM
MSRLLPRHIAGVHFDGSTIRVAEVRGTTPVRICEHRLPDGAVQRDEIIDEDAVAHGLRTLWRRAKIATRSVVLAIPPQQMVARPSSFPRLDHREQRQALRFEVADLVPFPADDVAFDFYDQGDRLVGGVRHASMLVVAARASSIHSLISAATAAKLTVTGVDAWPGALLRAVGLHDRDRAGPELVVQLVHDGVQVLIHHEGRLLLARTVVGLSSAAMGLELQAELARIEHVRQRLAGSTLTEAFVETRARLSPATEAVRSTLEHYFQQPDAVSIVSARVGGDTAMAATVASELASVLRIAVTIVTMRGDNDVESARRRGRSSESEQAAVALGLAMESRDAPALDFVPAKTREHRARQRQVRAGLVSSAASVVLIGGAAWSQRPVTHTAGLDSTRALLAAANAELGQAGGASGPTAELAGLIARADTLRAQATDWSSVVSQIAGISADGTWQTIAAPPVDPGRPAVVEITVVGSGPRSLGTWLEQLSKLTTLSEPWPSSPPSGDVAGAPFTINATVRAGVVPGTAP